MFIGSHHIVSPFFLAPMAGVSEMPFRVLAFEFGAGLATTELVSAKGLFYRNDRTRQYLTFNSEKERPYSLQLFGGEEESMTRAAVEAVKAGAQIIDINMGCPVKKVTKTGAGSALLCDPGRAANLIRQMRDAISDAVPITAKIRSGWDANQINCIDMGKALEDAGCAALAMHARTRAQGYSGKADWTLIRQLKQALTIPVIGNGDVVTPQDAMKMMTFTGCDAVMIGRGALGNPWIFDALKRYFTEGMSTKAPTNAERLAVIIRHLRAHIAFHEQLNIDRESAQLRAIRSFRSHLVWYSRGIAGASLFREKVMHLETLAAVEDATFAFFNVAEHETLAPESEIEAVDYRQAFG